MNHPARLHVDESYGKNHSFVIQAGFAIPSGNAESVLLEFLEDTFREKPAYRLPEFKGSSFRARHREAYEWFLQTVINTIALVEERTSIRTVISVDGNDNYRSEAYKNLRILLQRRLDLLGYPAEEREMARDFVRQMIWLQTRFTSFFPEGTITEAEIYFDEKHRLSEAFQQKVTEWVPSSNGTRLWRRCDARSSAYARHFNAIASSLPSTKQIPPITRFAYVNSKCSYLVQAADLLTHLMYASIKYRFGSAKPEDRMKYEMLCSVTSSDPVHPEILEALEWDGKEASCKDPSLFSRIELGYGGPAQKLA